MDPYATFGKFPFLCILSAANVWWITCNWLVWVILLIVLWVGFRFTSQLVE